MNIKDKIIVKILDVGINGEGIGKYENFTIFVPYALKGEEVEACVNKIKNNLIFASLVKIISPSKERIVPKCFVFGACGGCHFQHTNYDNQLKIKTDLVKTTLRKSLRQEFNVNMCVGSPKKFFYRNKIEIPINNDMIGFYKEGTNTIVPITDCPLCEDWFKKLLKIVGIFIKKYKITTYNKQTKKGNLRHLVARFLDNYLTVVFVCNEKIFPHQKELIEILKNNFSQLSVFQNINTKTSSEVLSENFKLLYGEPTQHLKDFDIMYEISPYSFLQVNRDMQNIIYQQILDNIDKNSVAIDAYSGAGVLSAILSPKCQFVYGIEIIKDATKNADKLVELNNIKNLKNLNGDCSTELPKLVNKLKTQGEQNINIILDPPRKGVSKEVINSILKCNPDKIIYLSCNPATLARDLKDLAPNYDIKSIQPYDMFPQTRHIETLVVLNRKKSF